MGPVDRSTLDAVLALEVRQVIEVVLGRLRLGPFLGLEPGVRGDQFEDHAVILLDVGGDPEVAARDERPLHVGNEGSGEDPPLLVAGLPPGVGEVDVDRAEARRRDEAGEELFGVAGDDADVGQAPLGDPLGRRRGVLPRELDADEVPAEISRRGVLKEETLSGTDLQLDRVVVAEDLGPGKRTFDAGQVQGERRTCRSAERTSSGMVFERGDGGRAVDQIGRFNSSRRGWEGTPMIRP